MYSNVLYVCVYDNYAEVYRFSCEEVYFYVNMRVSRYTCIFICMIDVLSCVYVQIYTRQLYCKNALKCIQCIKCIFM